MAASGAHEKALEIVREIVPASTDCQVLDIGAGMGALSARLVDAGYRVAACDLYPDVFEVSGVECRAVDARGDLPYDSGSIDVAVAVEVLEHIDGHETLFAEVARVLKPGGVFLFSTPNILSLKSRLMFLFTGYAYSFPSLDPGVLDPVEQHISPFTLDRYLWRIGQAGLDFDRIAVDKYQNTSRWLLFLAPLIWMLNFRTSRISASVRLQNATKLLLGRTLFVVARKPGAA